VSEPKSVAAHAATPKADWKPHAAAPNTHQRVLELVRAHLADRPGARVCDVPCGAGALSAQLASAGLDVMPVDIAAVEPFQFDPSRRRLHDCNRGLPFADAELDAVVSVEGIEHLESPTGFLRECARVLRPGGLLFLTTPNVDSLRSRKYVIGRGYHRFFGPDGDYAKDAGHIHPIDMMFVRNAIRPLGLVWVEGAVNRLSGKTWYSELLRPMLQRKLPAALRGEVPFYGDVMIYVLRRAA
jgi:SAM-dependent methyltransferase